MQHLGADIDHTRQLPDLAARAGIPVTLVGKAADILACEAAERHPAVQTADVLTHTLEAVRTPATRSSSPMSRRPTWPDTNRTPGGTAVYWSRSTRGSPHSWRCSTPPATG